MPSRRWSDEPPRARPSSSMYIQQCSSLEAQHYGFPSALKSSLKREAGLHFCRVSHPSRTDFGLVDHEISETSRLDARHIFFYSFNQRQLLFNNGPITHNVRLCTLNRHAAREQTHHGHSFLLRRTYSRSHG